MRCNQPRALPGRRSGCGWSNRIQRQDGNAESPRCVVVLYEVSDATGQGEVKSVSPGLIRCADFPEFCGPTSLDLLTENQRALPMLWKRPF
jgi:hypothetical protein